MPSITIDKRFCGPPNSGNGGYVCGLLAHHIGAGAEITLRAPPPLGQRLEIAASANGALDLRQGEALLATARPARIEISEIPVASYPEAENAVRRTPFDENNHIFPTCFVCGPTRAPGDGLRIFAGPLSARTGRKAGAFAASWIPDANLADDDGSVGAEFIWAALDCPTGYAVACHLTPGEAGTILLGRMSARIDQRPQPGDRCVVVAWPTKRTGRKLFASSALLRADGEVLAVAQATWLQVGQHTLPGQS